MPNAQNAGTPENIFKGNPTQLAAVDIESPLMEAKAPTCEYSLSRTEKLPKRLKNKATDKKRLCIDSCKSLWQMEGKRSLMISEVVSRTGSFMKASATLTPE